MPYFANNGLAVATPVTSSAGPMRESGGRIRVCTTGVGTPDSLRIVTAASPVPSWVRSSSRSYASDFGNVRTVARNAFASSGVNARSACCTRLPSWPSTSAGTSFGVWVTKKTPTPFERMRRTVWTVDSTNRLACILEEEVRLVEEEDEPRLVPVSDLGKLLEELRDEPHEHGRPQLRLVLHRRELQARDDPAPVRRRAQEVRDVELGLAEELGPAPRLEPDERAQENAHGLGREAADAPQLLASAVRVEEREQRAQVGEVEEREALLVRVVEDELEALFLRRVRAQHLRQEERAEVRDRRAHRHAGADAAEGQVLDRKAGRGEGEPELGRALLRRAVRRAGHGHSGHVALDVGREHRDAGGGELLRDDLERSGLPGAGRARDQPVPIHRREGQADGRFGDEDSPEHPCPELDRAALRRVRRGDRGPERRRVWSRSRHGARSYQRALRIQLGRLLDPRSRKYGS